MSALEIRVDRDRCAGITMCVQFAPGVFGLDDEGQSMVLDADGAAREVVVDAASQCPMEAITVVDAGSGETLVPAY